MMDSPARPKKPRSLDEYAVWLHNQAVIEMGELQAFLAVAEEGGISAGRPNALSSRRHGSAS